MSKPSTFPREAWELRRDLRAYEGEIALLIRTNEELAGENAALRAQVARLARKQPPRRSVALAALACLWDAYARAWRRWPYALAYLTTAALTVAAIVALRWLGGL